MPQLLAIIGVLVLALGALAAAFVVGWRAKSGLVLRPIVWFSKRFLNPRQMRTAGTPGAYAGIIRHRGRTSGTAYETPVTIVDDGDAFLVALPYGERTQWLRNVLAAGSAEIVTEGAGHRVDHPEVVPMADVIDRFAAGDQPTFRMLRVNSALRLHDAGRREAAPQAA